AKTPGDRNAIIEMLERAPDEVTFSLGSPLEIINSGVNPRDLVVFGAMVKRPPFWIANGRPVRNIEDLKIKNLSTYRPETLKTGNYLAHFIAKKIGLPEGAISAEIDDVGGELPLLIEKKRKGLKDWGALTVDILGLARANFKTDADEHCSPVLSLSQ